MEKKCEKIAHQLQHFPSVDKSLMHKLQLLCASNLRKSHDTTLLWNCVNVTIEFRKTPSHSYPLKCKKNSAKYAVCERVIPSLTTCNIQSQTNQYIS